MKKQAVAVALLLMLAAPVNASDLKDVYEDVIRSDPRITINSLGVEVGKARERQALGGLLPQVGVSSSLSRTRLDRDKAPRDEIYSGERHALTIRQPLFDMAAYREWQQSQQVTDMRDHELEKILAEVRLDTVERYFALLRAEEERRVIVEDREATEKRVQQTQALFNKQLARITDLLEAQSRLDLLVAEEIKAEQSVDMARQNLNELTNTMVEHVATLRDDVVLLPSEEDIQLLINHAMSINPELQGLQTDVAISRVNLLKQKARHYPTVNLQLSKQISDTGYDNIQTPRTDTDIASINLNIPLYSGGTTSAQVREADHQVGIAKASLDRKNREIQKQIHDMYMGMNTVSRHVAATDKSVKSSEKSVEAMTRSFELGAATIIDVLDAQNNLTLAKRKYQQARFDYVLTKVRLEFLIGRLTDQTIDDVNNWLAAGN